MARKELLIRIDPDLADRLAIQASVAGTSRNALIGDVLAEWSDGWPCSAPSEGKKP